MSSFLSDMGQSFSKYLPSIGNNIVSGMDRRYKAIEKERLKQEKLEETQAEEQKTQAEFQKKQSEAKVEAEASRVALNDLMRGKKTIDITNPTTPLVKTDVDLTNEEKAIMFGGLNADDSKSYNEFRRLKEQDEAVVKAKLEQDRKVAQAKLEQDRKVAEVNRKDFQKRDEDKIKQKQAEAKISEKTAKSYTDQAIEILMKAGFNEREMQNGITPDGLQRLYEENPQGYNEAIKNKERLNAEETALQENLTILIGKIEATAEDYSWIAFANTERVRNTIAENPLKGAEAIVKGIKNLLGKGGMSTSDMNLIYPYILSRTGIDVRKTQGYNDLWEAINKSLKGQ
jgi:hypothetical protein